MRVRSIHELLGVAGRPRLTIDQQYVRLESKEQWKLRKIDRIQLKLHTSTKLEFLRLEGMVWFSNRYLSVSCLVRIWFNSPKPPICHPPMTFAAIIMLWCIKAPGQKAVPRCQRPSGPLGLISWGADARVSWSFGGHHLLSQAKSMGGPQSQFWSVSFAATAQTFGGSLTATTTQKTSGVGLF